MNQYPKIKIVECDKLSEAEFSSKTPFVSSEFLYKIDYECKYSQEDNGKQFLEHYEQNKALNTTAKKILLEISSHIY